MLSQRICLCLPLLNVCVFGSIQSNHSYCMEYILQKYVFFKKLYYTYTQEPTVTFWSNDSTVYSNFSSVWPSYAHWKPSLIVPLRAHFPQACDLTFHVLSLLVSSLPSPCSGLVLQESCPTLCNAVVCSPPGSFVYGIFQARKSHSGCSVVGGHFLLQVIFPT